MTDTRDWHTKQRDFADEIVDRLWGQADSMSWTLKQRADYIRGKAAPYRVVKMLLANSKNRQCMGGDPSPYGFEAGVQYGLNCLLLGKGDDDEPQGLQPTTEQDE